jgi:hypothetical protein
MAFRSIRFGKLQAANQQAYGWWCTDDGRIIEINSAEHSDAAIMAVINGRDVNTKGAPAKVSVGNFALEYMGWIGLINLDNNLQVRCWTGRVAKRAYNALGQLIGTTPFESYDLSILGPNSSDNASPTQLQRGIEADVVLAAVRDNIVQQIMPEMVAAARKRLHAYMTANPSKLPRPRVQFT